MQIIIVMNYIENIRHLMNLKEMNIEGLQKEIERRGHKLSRNSIGNILNDNIENRTSPKISTLQVIADALNVELVTLFTNQNSNSNNLIFGLVEYDGKSYQIHSKYDLENLLKLME